MLRIKVAAILILLAACALTSCSYYGDGVDGWVTPPVMIDDYAGHVAGLEVKYATKRCHELGVTEDTPEWSTCLREKGLARWALKNCGGPLNSTSIWWPSICAHADDE